jgi:hypothetical protein
MSDSTRIADLRVSRLTIFFVRYVYPLVGIWALHERRRNQRVVEKTAERLGADAARVVVAAQQSSHTMRRLTYLIAVATLVNTGFVIYSALR